MKRDTASTNPDLHIELEVEGATEEDLDRGVAAAIAVFEGANVDPWVAAIASHKLEWHIDPSDYGTAEDAELFVVYSKATEAALKAACEELPNTRKKYDFGVRWDDDEPSHPSPFALEVVYPTTDHGRPAHELMPRKAGKRLVLNGWKWEWEYFDQ